MSRAERQRKIAYGKRWDDVASYFGWRVIGYTDNHGGTFRSADGTSFQVHGHDLLGDFERGLNKAFNEGCSDQAKVDAGGLIP